MKTSSIVGLAAAGAAGLFLVVLPVLSMNSIPVKEVKVQTDWSNVESAYTRRNDLIPSLIGVVQSSANAEIKLVVDAMKARAEGLKSTVNVNVTDADAMAKFAQNQNALTTALTNMKMVVERYPEFKANRNFLQLQNQMEGTENRINVARRDYNLSVGDLNAYIRTYPGVVANMVVGVKPAVPFAADGSKGLGRAQEAPKPMEMK